MTYLILQILVCLLLAFLLGAVLAWWLGRRSGRLALERDEADWRRQLDDCRKALAECEAARAQPQPGRAGGDEARPAAAPAREAAAPPGIADVPVAPEDEEPPTAEEPPQPDDLTRVEGIGPKIQGLLNAAGIHTWRQLSETPVDALQAILDAAGPRYRIHDPGTWPDQAKLAAEGRWDELDEFQDLLDGGRQG